MPNGSVLHLDGGHAWAGGQNQVRLLMRELAGRGIQQGCFCPRGSPLAERLRAEGLPVAEGVWHGGADPRAVYAVARMARNFDILHCHDAHALQIALIPALLGRKRLVATRRVHFRTSPGKWNRADAVIAISETVAASLLSAGVHAARIYRISSGVDQNEVANLPALTPSLRDRLGLKPADFLIGIIGKLSPYKGQTIIPPVAQQVADVHWAIIGDGPLRAVIERAVGELRVQDRVKLTGTIADARRALRELDLFLFPSPDEPLGSSLLDAMACGVPVLAARAAGAAEILTPVDALTGTSLFPPGDVAALAQLITRLRHDPAQRQRMVAAQRGRLENFTMARTGDQTIALYKNVLKGAA